LANTLLSLAGAYFNFIHSELHMNTLQWNKKYFFALSLSLSARSSVCAVCNQLSRKVIVERYVVVKLHKIARVCLFDGMDGEREMQLNFTQNNGRNDFEKIKLKRRRVRRVQTSHFQYSSSSHKKAHTHIQLSEKASSHSSLSLAL
jgi:predicted PolB exonuclease-like 3'-5' exonuclease